ncbi:MAG: hypothetical protein JNK78_18480 [Planctomycetes bacterium]|nr:hypothetical protein [Planctomycetota bacterium]
MSLALPFVIAVVVAVPGVLIAQQVTVTASMPVPAVASTTIAGTVDTQGGSVVPGTVASSQSVGQENASARITANVTQLAIGCTASIEHRLDVATAAVPASSASATADVLLQFAATTNESVVLQISSTLAATGGAPAPTLQVDVDDDGSIDWQSGPATPSFAVPRVLGPTPTFVRVRTASSLAISGSVVSSVTVAVAPEHPTQIDVVLFGCSVPYHLYSFRTFGGGVEFGTFGLPPTGPVLLVFGLGVFPFVLPSAAPSPCVVLPTLDIVALIPSPLGYSLPLPPAVRPVTFWAQAVPLTPAGFEATGAYRIQAN